MSEDAIGLLHELDQAVFGRSIIPGKLRVVFVHWCTDLVVVHGIVAPPPCLFASGGGDRDPCHAAMARDC